MFKRDNISTKAQLLVPQEVVPEPPVQQSTAPTTEAISELRLGASTPDIRVGYPTVSEPEVDMEIECLRHDESDAADNVFPEFVSFHAEPMNSPFRMDNSPVSTNSLESELHPKTVADSTPNIAASTGTHGSICVAKTLDDEGTLFCLQMDNVNVLISCYWLLGFFIFIFHHLIKPLD